MVERGRDPRLAQEALTEAAVLGELGRNDLQSDLATECQLLSTVNRAHPATADERLDLVAGKLAADHRVGAASYAHPASVCQERDVCNVARVNDVRKGRS